MAHFHIEPVDVTDPVEVQAVVDRLEQLALEGQSVRVARGDLQVVAEVISELMLIVFANSVKDTFENVDPVADEEELPGEESPAFVEEVIDG